MDKTTLTILYILLGLLCIAVASIIIQDGSDLIADLGKHIMRLFRMADFNPDRRGFGAFIQLIGIAFFVGWVISRFKNKG